VTPLLIEATNEDIIQMIRRFYVKMGIMTVPTTDMLLVLIHSIREGFGNWRISQVEHAFDLGLQGSLEISMNLYNKPFNVVFLAQLMASYKAFITPVLEKENNKQAEQVPPSEEEQKEISIKAIDKCFDHFKVTGNLLNFGNTIYNDLKDKFNYDDADFIEQAKSILKNRIDKQLERAVFKKDLESAIASIEVGNVDDSTEKMLKRIICDLKLKKFFNELIEMEMNPLDFMYERL